MPVLSLVEVAVFAPVLVLTFSHSEVKQTIKNCPTLNGIQECVMAVN